ncbi:MAG: hypothetical protein E7603_10545 [Ruminococcaceae bacterium]|nr:hypothetical protein [Oscillospiraceae bacterium]
MKTPRISDSMNYLDHDLIQEAVRERKPVKTVPFLKWGSLAACLCVLLMTAMMILPNLLNGNLPNENNNPLYKPVHVENRAIVWPWEYKTIYEKYTFLFYDGKGYNGRGKEIRAELLGEALGEGEAKGQDIYTEKIYTERFTVYRINGVSEEYLIAVEMDGKFYVFDAHKQNAFATLGEMADTFSMEQNISLNRFSVQGKTLKTKYYALGDDSSVWEILKGCKNAPAVNGDSWRTQADYISFTVTSEALGVYKNVMYVTEDGYLFTNAFDFANVFEIGKEAAMQIINHVKEISEQTEPIPYQSTITGKITEVEENYFILDTTPVCVNEKDGKIYKIMAEDIRIDRVLSFEKVDVGDLVVVTYDGIVKDGNLIEGATNMQKGFFSNEESHVMIPE